MTEEVEYPTPVPMLAELIPLPQFLVAFYDNKGEITMISTCTEEETATRMASEFGLKWKRDAPADGDYYIYDDMFVRMEPRPSRDHVFDWEFHEWVDGRTIEQLRDLKKAEVDKVRAARSEAPIEYDGAALDADKRSQENISAKLQEIRENQDLGREMPVDTLFWRDADNEMHHFEDMKSFKKWLGLLAIVITERGTLLYQWAWGKKALVDAATTPEEVEAVSLEQ